MDDVPPSEDGLFSTVAHTLKTARSAVANRIELFLVEWQEERLRLLEVVLLLLIGIVCALMALILTTFIIVILFWDTHRFLVLASLAAAYAVAAAVAIATLRAQLRRWRAFSETLEQIRKDCECFKDKN